MLSCGDCGADMACGHGCNVCSEPAVLAALGISRRRWRALPWLTAAALLLTAMLVSLDTDPIAQQAIAKGGGEPSGLDVIVYPGGASYANFTRDAPAVPIAVPGRPAPEGIVWRTVAPPLAVLGAIGIRVVWIAAVPRRIEWASETPLSLWTPRAVAPPVTANDTGFADWATALARALVDDGPAQRRRAEALDDLAWLTSIAAGFSAAGSPSVAAWLATATSRPAREVPAPEPTLRPGAAESWLIEVMVRMAPWNQRPWSLGA